MDIEKKFWRLESLQAVLLPFCHLTELWTEIQSFLIADKEIEFKFPQHQFLINFNFKKCIFLCIFWWHSFSAVVRNGGRLDRGVSQQPDLHTETTLEISHKKPGCENKKWWPGPPLFRVSLPWLTVLCSMQHRGEMVPPVLPMTNLISRGNCGKIGKLKL